jgi:hypothetical protein
MANFWYGTITNTSSPSNPVPCTVTIDNSDWLTAVSPLLVKINFTLGQIHGAYVNINRNLIELTKVINERAKSISDQTAHYQAQAALISQKNTISASLSANKIQTNDFFRSASIETPVLPDFSTQIQTSIQEGATMIASSGMSVAVRTGSNYAVSGMQTFIKGTAVYKTVSSWIENIGATLLEIPDNARQLASKIAAKLPGGGS